MPPVRSDSRPATSGNPAISAAPPRPVATARARECFATLMQQALQFRQEGRKSRRRRYLSTVGMNRSSSTILTVRATLHDMRERDLREVFARLVLRHAGEY